MAEVEDSAAFAVVAARVDDLREDIRNFGTLLQEMTTSLVPRNEWVLRNQHVDHEFRAQGREIGDLRGEIRAEKAAREAAEQSRRIPWTATVGVFIAGAAGLKAFGIIG